MTYLVQKPVALIMFNRPDLLAQVFGAIRRVQPKKLFLISDGPRNDEDVPKINECRRIAENVDWECRIYKDYSEKNLGSKIRPFSGLTRVFEQVTEALILEDDCVPNDSFFRFTSELLDRYRDEQKVFGIAGANHLDPNRKYPESCWFSPLTSTWGFATWRRSWNKIDLGIAAWKNLRETNWLAKQVGNKKIADVYARKFDKLFFDVYGGRAGWDYAYLFAMLRDNALDARPSVNMVSNIGFREDASNTTEKTPWADFPLKEMEFPLRYPQKITCSINLELDLFKATDPNFQYMTRARRKLKNILTKLFQTP